MGRAIVNKSTTKQTLKKGGSTKNKKVIKSKK